MAKDYLVPVCDKCLRFSCYAGQLLCENSKTAGTTEIPASDLRQMRKEAKGNFGRAQVEKICGSTKEPR